MHITKSIACQVALITALIFIAVAVIVRDSRRSDDTGRSRGSFRPHLTVPILSPFTSFVSNFNVMRKL